MSKDLIDRQQLLAEMHMAADGNMHDIYRNIERGETQYPALTFELAVSMIKDMPAVKPETVRSIIEETCDTVCNGLCRHADTIDENAECDLLREGKTCPLDRLG